MKKSIFGAVLALFISSFVFISCSFTTGNDGNAGGTPVTPPPVISDGMTSVQMAKNMTAGWNLGNTLDAPTETNWGMPLTTQAMIDEVYAVGFRTIRIPVSWSGHVDDSYNINSTWMNRVKTVVDYAYKKGMCVILNIHHDNYSILEISSKKGYALSDDEVIKTKSKNYLSKVWTQIAGTFASYDNKLVFEVLNEPRDIGGKWKGNEWWTDDPVVLNLVTEYEQVCVNAIRAVSGNENRFLLVPCMCATSDTNILNMYNLPSDTASDRIIMSIHAYSPYNFAMSTTADTVFGEDDKSTLDGMFSFYKTKYVDNGIGVVIGETSASDKNNLSEREKWAEYFFGQAAAKGYSCVLWDNMVTVGTGGDIESGECHGYFNRKTLSWFFPTMIQKMMKAYYPDYNCTITPYSKPTPETIGWNGSATENLLSSPITTAWDGVSIAAGKCSGAKAGSILQIVCQSSSGGSIRLINGDWSVVYNSGNVLNGDISGDDIKFGSGTVTLYYVLTAGDAADWKTSGFTIAAGENTTISSLIFQP